MLIVVVVAAVVNKMNSTFSFFSFIYRPPLEESRSPTGSVLVPSLSVRSGVTKSPLSSSSESFPSRGLFVKLLRISRWLIYYSSLPAWLVLTLWLVRPISAFSLPLWWLCRKLLRLTLSPSLKTLTWPPSTPNVSLFLVVLYSYVVFTILFFRCYHVSHCSTYTAYSHTDISIPIVNPRISPWLDASVANALKGIYPFTMPSRCCTYNNSNNELWWLRLLSTPILSLLLLGLTIWLLCLSLFLCSFHSYSTVSYSSFHVVVYRPTRVLISLAACIWVI